MVIAADDLLLGGTAANIVLYDTVASHIDAHIRGRFIGALPRDALKNGIQHGKNLNIAVIIDSGFAIGFQMVGVDHINVV